MCRIFAAAGGTASVCIRLRKMKVNWPLVLIFKPKPYSTRPQLLTSMVSRVDSMAAYKKYKDAGRGTWKPAMVVQVWLTGGC